MKHRRRLLAAGTTLAVGAMVAVGATTARAGSTPTPPSSPNVARALAVRNAAQLVADRPAYLMASADDQFVQGSTVSSGSTQYVSYERTYAGLPVRGGDFVLVMNGSGQLVYNSVAMHHPIGGLSTTPTVSQAAAVTTATRQLTTVTGVEGAHLVVDALGDTPRLAWESTVDGADADGPSRLSVFVDALTGQVLGTQEHVMDGTGTAAWNGPNPVPLNTTHAGTTFSLKDPNVTGLSCQDAANNTTFTGADDSWGNGDATSRETGCVDALFGAQSEVKMLSQWLGRNAMDGNGGAWPIRIGLNQVNAFYDGTQVQVGHNQAGQWIGAIDVIAHEMGHGIDDHTPGGISKGGTQEFIADTFGASTEWFTNEPAPFDKPDFTVGEQVNLVGKGPIRFMYNPSLITGHPNCFSSSIPQTEVHAAAGPGNHWFYLLAEGSNPTDGQPTSPTCNNSTVTGVGIRNAITILYNAMLMKTSGSSYLMYRVWTLQAAKNLTPGNCGEFNTVKAAWDAVSVPAQPGEPTCSGGGAPLALANPGNQTATVGTAASLTLSASGGTTPYTFSATGLPAGLSVNPTSGVISGTPTTAGASTVTATVKDSKGATASQTFNWTVTPQGGGCSSPGQKLGNPGFESGSAPWTATPAVIGAFNGQAPHSGTRLAWLDGYGQAHTDKLSQSVSLPAGCGSYTFTFFLHIDSAETGTTAADTLTVQAGSTTLATFSNLNKANGYVQKSFDLKAFAGQTVTLMFTGVENGARQTSFVVDDTALTVS